MSKYNIKEINRKEVWERFLLSSSPKSFLQSWNWGETNRLMGKKIFRLGIYELGRLKGVCLIIKELAKRGPHFLIPAGPVLDWKDKKLVKYFISYATSLAKEEKVWFIRMRPELLDSHESQNLFKRFGFNPSPMHLHAENTWVLNINKTDSELLAGMRKTTRYLIRKSLMMGLSMEVSVDPKKAKIIKKLQDETVERLSFVGFPEKLFEAQLGTFGSDAQGAIFICRKGGFPLVASIVIFYGEYAFYHNSASSSKYREIPASYFTQWSIIQEGKRRGCKYYDMWGATPPGKKSHRFSGPSQFKEGFGPDRVDWLHAQDLPVSPLYKGTYLFELIRKRIRRL